MTFDVIKKIDWNLLDKYIGNNLIQYEKHPEYDLWILNYSPKVYFKKLWDLYTYNCKGLIINKRGEIIGRSLKKIKNINEFNPGELSFDENFEVFEKIDGILIQLFYHEESDEWILASKKSFISDHVILANNILNKNTFKFLNKKYTYLFELTTSFKFKCDNDLILLAAIETKTGNDMFYEDLNKTYSKYYNIVSKLKIKSFSELNKLINDNNENRKGIIIRFENGSRVKIENEKYKKLYSQAKNISSTVIWEFLKKEENINNLIENIPHETHDWVKNMITDLQLRFLKIKNEILETFIRIYHINEAKNKKDFANQAKKNKYYHVLYLLYDKKKYKDYIWDIIKPEYSSPIKII